MFSTFFYILILFYQNLYSGLGYSFNSEINKVNISILSKDYDKAISLINLIEKKYIFNNESIFKTKVLISIKRPTSFVNFNVNSFKIITALAKASPKQGLIVAVLDETLEIEKWSC